MRNGLPVREKTYCYYFAVSENPLTLLSCINLEKTTIIAVSCIFHVSSKIVQFRRGTSDKKSNEGKSHIGKIAG